MSVEFKALLKSYRLRAGFGLRQFAELVGELPSNYAAVESGLRSPWRPMEKLQRVADALGLAQGSADWDAFFLAARQNRALPPDVEHILERPLIPVLLRTVDQLRLGDDAIQKLIEHIQRQYGKKTRRKA